MRSRLGSLRLRLVVLLVLALLPAFALMVFTANESRSRAIADTQDNALRLTELAAANQRQLIDGARDILITLAQLPAIRSQDRSACLFFLTNVLMQHPLYANFGAADGTGDVFCMTLPQKMPLNIADQGYFKQSMASRDFAISEYQISAINSQALITLAYPLIDADDQPQGIVFATLDLRWLEQFMTAAPLPAGSTLRVIDPRGVILASYPDGDFEIGQLMPEKAIASLVLEETSGLTQGSDRDGVARLFAFTPLHAGADSDVYMIISIPAEAAFAESNRNLQRNLTGLAVGGLLALAVAWVGTHVFFLRQVNALLRVTRRLSAGDLSARTEWTPGYGELDQLASAFDEMASALQRREQEQAWARAQIQRQTARAEALARIAGKLNAKLELESVLQAICEETSRSLHALATGVVVVQPGKNDLFHIGGPQVTTYLETHTRPPSSAQLEAAGTRLDPLTLRIDLLGASSRNLPRLYHSLGASSLLSASLVHEGVVIGRLDLFVEDSAQVGEDEVTLLKGIADEAALAITNARLYTALRLEERARANLLYQVISAQEEERMRIARELHDETSQSLTALLVGLDTIRIASQSDIRRIDDHIRDLKTITEDMLANIHRLIADLRPSLLDDLGLVAAIEWYGEQRLKPYGVSFHLQDDMLDLRLPRPVETTLFRVVQEGLTNILRHAQASAVTVRLAQEDELILLEICDDGVGFDPQQIESPDPGGRGFGLRGMRERAAILGGSLELESSPGAGTIVRIRFYTYRDEEVLAHDSHPAGG
ncbi:MAG: cache domain-containing protein [Anaerolineales bacterium]|nr:cache domain-containing protein [Anaerolineales bacterium]